MADIAQERDWMARMAGEARQREDAADTQRLARLGLTAPESERCTCDHAPHEIMHPAGTLPFVRRDLITLRWCHENDCLCGVKPCSYCGHHARFERDDALFNWRRRWRCRQCGAAWPGRSYN